MKNKGFTLIELLVVVLIIGILAAIAVPKYQVAVDRADFRKYQAMANSLKAAYDEHFLITGNGTNNFEDLTITVPSDFTLSYETSYYQCVSNSEMFCCMSKSHSDASGSINCGKNDLSVSYKIYLLGFGSSQINRQSFCLAQEENTRANKLCSSLGSAKQTIHAWTPEGFQNSYIHYLLD